MSSIPSLKGPLPNLNIKLILSTKWIQPDHHADREEGRYSVNNIHRVFHLNQKNQKNLYSVDSRKIYTEETKDSKGAQAEFSN